MSEVDFELSDTSGFYYSHWKFIWSLSGKSEIDVMDYVLDITCPVVKFKFEDDFDRTYSSRPIFIYDPNRDNVFIKNPKSIYGYFYIENKFLSCVRKSSIEADNCYYSYLNDLTEEQVEKEMKEFFTDYKYALKIKYLNNKYNGLVKTIFSNTEYLPGTVLSITSNSSRTKCEIVAVLENANLTGMSKKRSY